MTALAPIGYCSWCGRPLHRTPDDLYPNIATDWCDCGWWDILPTREEVEVEGRIFSLGL